MKDETLVLDNSIEKKIAKFISYLLHPLLMPTYGFVLLFYTKNYISTFTPQNSKLILVLITFAFTFLFPTLNTLILLKMKRIKTLEMESTKERVIPYLSTSVYFFALFYLFHTAHLPKTFNVLILGAAISILLTLFINFKWKISAHSIGIGGIIGAIIGISYRLHIDLQFLLFIVIALSGLVGYARLKLNVHSPAQVYTGFLLGFLVELFLMFIY